MSDVTQNKEIEIGVKSSIGKVRLDLIPPVVFDILSSNIESIVTDVEGKEYTIEYLNDAVTALNQLQFPDNKNKNKIGVLTDVLISLAIYIYNTNDDLYQTYFDLYKLKGQLFIPYVILKAIAEIREYGNNKYGSPWKWLDFPDKIDEFITAARRHLYKHVWDEYETDDESSLPHISHAITSIAMALELLNRE